MTFKQSLANIAERAIWTAVQGFAAVAIIDGAIDETSFAAAGIAAGLSVVKNVVLPLAATRLAKRQAQLEL